MEGEGEGMEGESGGCWWEGVETELAMRRGEVTPSRSSAVRPLSGPPAFDLKPHCRPESKAKDGPMMEGFEASPTFLPDGLAEGPDAEYEGEFVAKGLAHRDVEHEIDRCQIQPRLESCESWIKESLQELSRERRSKKSPEYW